MPMVDASEAIGQGRATLTQGAWGRARDRFADALGRA
jgi:hypothetical protein